MSGGVSFGLGVQIDGQIRVIADSVEHRQRILKDAFPLIMSYFEPQKRTSTGRSFIESQRSRWCSIVSTAEQLVIVRIRVNPYVARKGVDDLTSRSTISDLPTLSNIRRVA